MQGGDTAVFMFGVRQWMMVGTWQVVMWPSHVNHKTAGGGGKQWVKCMKAP